MINNINKVILFFIFCSLVISCSAEDNKIKMIEITGTEFVMGSEKYRSGNLHKVLLDDFYFAENLVTVSDWILFCENTNYNYNWDELKGFINSWRENFWYIDPLLEMDIDPSWPIIHINWYEAVLYSNWLSREHGLEEAYKIGIDEFDYDFLTNQRFDVTLNENANGYRLPTEAEWEFVAQQGFINPEFDVDYISYDGLPSPLSELKPNNIGIFGMDANTKTWCWDFFDYQYYEKSEYKSPLGPGIANIDTRRLYPGELEAYGDNLFFIRIVRGGSIYSDPGLGFVYSRSRYVDTKRYDTGIRLVRNKN